MVVIETALIGGAGYAAYRGGEKAVHVGRRKMDDMARNKRRQEDSRAHAVRTQNRSERLQQITESRRQMTQSGSTTGNSTPAGGSATLQNHNESLQKDRFQSIKERYSEARKPAPKKGFFSKLTGNNKKKMASK